MSLFGAIEAGGTKFVCLIGSSPENILAEERFPTTMPDETLGNVIRFFRESRYYPDISAIGISCFGPVDLNPNSPTYGYITSTPKPGWKYVEVKGKVSRELNLPAYMDTDVNGAAIGEGIWGAAMNLSDYVYYTIGTGIGGGAIVNGKPVHGLVHEEMGHVRIPHDTAQDPFEGNCPYHGDCFEGLASGPAIKARWGKPAELLEESHSAWGLEAQYIAYALHNTICTLSPQKIILGGGVMQQRHLFPLIQKRLALSLHEYVQHPMLLDRLDEYIVSPILGNRAGALGALAMAKFANQ